MPIDVGDSSFVKDALMEGRAEGEAIGEVMGIRSLLRSHFGEDPLIDQVMPRLTALDIDDAVAAVLGAKDLRELLRADVPINVRDLSFVQEALAEGRRRGRAESRAAFTEKILRGYLEDSPLVTEILRDLDHYDSTDLLEPIIVGEQ